ncbi:zinc ribbon domain-containing protein [Haloplanus halophilus]|uniref:zinc ribbon domain-containing protein n=1 Tax=Haloplanus halophilus TaxID=2949993 RepID=UPI00203B10AA|nr:zinc ribbon domain-containing protein [Haloplanus sp. GDY1]
MVDTERRALIAVAVSVAGAAFGIGGAGHAYLREWGRAFVWFSFVLGAGLVLVASFADPETATLSTLPLRVTGPVLLLLALNTVDAYVVARRGSGGSAMGTAERAEEPTVSCPSCGRDLDPELSFCPWCAGSTEEE